MREIGVLTLSVLRDARWDCTNNGISSRFNEILLICLDGGPHKIDLDQGIPENLCYLRCREFGDRRGFSIVPADVKEDGEIVARDGKWYMMGGNFAYTSDSRFSDMLDGMYGAVAIHDRAE